MQRLRAEEHEHCTVDRLRRGLLCNGRDISSEVNAPVSKLLLVSVSGCLYRGVKRSTKVEFGILVLPPRKCCCCCCRQSRVNTGVTRTSLRLFLVRKRQATHTVLGSHRRSAHFNGECRAHCKHKGEWTYERNSEIYIAWQRSQQSSTWRCLARRRQCSTRRRWDLGKYS